MRLFNQRMPDEGIVLKRGGYWLSYEVWLPSYMQNYLPYLPSQLPVIRRHVVIEENVVVVANLQKPLTIEKMWLKEVS